MKRVAGSFGGFGACVIFLSLLLLAQDPFLPRSAALGFTALLLFAIVSLLRNERAFAVMAAITILVSVSCFGFLFVEQIVFGGTAINGKIETGGYFVGSHGLYSPVSPRVFKSLLIPEMAVIGLFPVMFSLGAFHQVLHRKPLSETKTG